MSLSSSAALAALSRATAHNWSEHTIGAIRWDSRQVEQGDLFVAYQGVAVDAHRYVSSALDRGAWGCVVERPLPELVNVPHLVVPDGREALAWLFAAWYDNPGRKMTVVGVTGTDGKTTTTRLISSILRAAGLVTGAIDTVAASIADQEMPTGFHTTTPDVPEMQAYLAQMVETGVTHAVIEATSHGLAQHRVTGCAFDLAVVTNITHEHLDAHGSYEAYRDAKARLFRMVAESDKPGTPKAAVLNADDRSYAYLREIAVPEQLCYSLEAGADLWAEHVVDGPDGMRFTSHLPNGAVAIVTPLVGRYNVSNILAAMGAAHVLGVSAQAMQRGVAEMRGIVGRMERIDQGQPYTTIVDFAHTPNALENALRTARSLTAGRVIVVFGCAGLRDTAKRPWMGRIAAELADQTIITAEDPRTESLDAIMEEIAEGSRAAGGTEGETYIKIGDRAEAIGAALDMALPGDLVIVTGKGHERSMCFGETEYPWSDQEAMQQALAERGFA